MVEAKHVSGKNIFWSTLTVKSRGGKIFEFLHCPFEGRANMHHKIQPNWLTGRCCLAGGSKGQCRKSKIFLSLLLPMQVDQYIFFPETCFAPTISEPEFTVCTLMCSNTLLTRTAKSSPKLLLYFQQLSTTTTLLSWMSRISLQKRQFFSLSAFLEAITHCWLF